MESRENNGQMVLPIFFHVEPRDVRKQTKDFGKKFHQLANSFKDKGTVESWKKALREAGNLKGWDLKSPENRNESKLIQIVVKSVWDELRKTLSDVPENLVGIDSVVEELLDLLNIGCPDVKIIGIWGMGGIGKTTIAETIFHKIHDKFEGKVILEDIREASRQKSLVCLQNRLLSTVLNQEVQSINSENEGKLCIKNRLHAKKVLIILDDVDNIKQLEALVGRPDWFGLGSRIIITTRDKHVLEVHQVDDIYEAKELDLLPSLKLFSKHAFRKDQPPNDFLELAKDVVRIAGGLPLALKVLGSFLVDKRSPVVWRSTLDKLKKIPDKEIQEKLKISYDGLDDLDKEIFLNIACFFIGMDKEYVIDIIDGCGFPTEVGILNLNQRSLLKIGKYNELRMHDQLRDMGRYIINQESPNEPGERSRLWSREEVLNVLEKRKGTRKVKGLQLQGFREMIDLRTEAISDMSELRLLQIDGANLVGDFNNLPSELRWLSWKRCPMKSIPSDFPLGKLAVLELTNSKIEQVWNGWHQNKLEKLKVLNLSQCELLTKTPDFSRLPNLEKLYLKECRRLTELPCSVCDLKYLKKLILSGCSNLNRLPDLLGNLTELEELKLAGCKLLCSLPDSIGKMGNLKTLLLDVTSITELPDAVGFLENIENLSAKYCKELVKLPDSIGKMGNLKTLLLDGTSITELPDAVGFLENIENLSANLCKELVKLPDSMGRTSLLRRFSMYETGIVKLPEDFGMLSSLTELNLERCSQLRELPCGTCNLKSLKILKLSGCSNLNIVEELLGSLKQMEVIKLAYCKLPSRSPGWICNMRNLKSLELDRTSITELPNAVGSLENVEKLSVRDCKNLVKLPDSMVEMRRLRELSISGSSIVKLPEDFGMLSSLESLLICDCREFRGFPENLGSLTRLKSLNLNGNSKMGMVPNSLSGLCSLKYLRAKRCNLSEGGIPSDIGKLSSLSELDLSHNNFSSLPEMPTTLGYIDVRNCISLKSLPELPTTLREIDVENCISLKSLPDLSDLKHLSRLNLTNCKKLAEIQGIENVKKYLQKLWVNGCSRALVNSVKKSFGQGGLPPQLSYFSFDGSKIPDCFIPLKISSPHDGREWEIGPTRLWNPEQHQNLITCVLCFVLTKTPKETYIPLYCDIIDGNGQKLSGDLMDIISIGPSKSHQDPIHVFNCGRSFFTFRSVVKQGFQVSFRIEADSGHGTEVVVKEAGVHLVYEETAESTYKRIANAISLSLHDDDVGGEASSSTKKR